MTVIAYRDGILATDSRATNDEGLMIGAIAKIWRRADGSLCAASGGAGDCQSFAGWFLAGDEAVPWEAKDHSKGFAGLVITPGGRVMIWNFDGRSYQIEAPFYARGYGAEIAIGAMAMGARADQAVEIACRWSVWCGGPVQVLQLCDLNGGKY